MIENTDFEFLLYTIMEALASPLKPFYNLNETQTITKYGKSPNPVSSICPKISVSQRLQNSIEDPNAKIRRLCKTRQLSEAVRVLDIMEEESNEVSFDSYIFLLRVCTKMQALAEGRQVHAHIIKGNLMANVFLLNTLINMFVKCESLEDAVWVFDKMPEKNICTWSTIIGGYAQRGNSTQAVYMFSQMKEQGFLPNDITYLSVFSACSKDRALLKGRQIHAEILKTGLRMDIFLGNCIVAMYAKCCCIDDAFQIFKGMPIHDVVSWNALISGYAEYGDARGAFKLFTRMQYFGFQPNIATCMKILTVCTTGEDLDWGKHVHMYIVAAGFGSDIIVSNMLISMYVKCESVANAWKAFNSATKRDVVTWNAMISGFSQSGENAEAIMLFDKMCECGLKPDRVTYLNALAACASIRYLHRGKHVHGHLVKAGMETEMFVGSKLVDMYAKCGSTKDARGIFDRMTRRNLVLWTAMISCYVENGDGSHAIELFGQMEQHGIMADKVTYISVLCACTNIGALEWGGYIHNHLVRNGIELDVFVGSTLIDMYAKCGSIKAARQVFSRISIQNVVLYTSMLSGYAEHGYANEALNVLKGMLQEGFRPDNVTFVSILGSCSNGGLTDDGLYYFVSISQVFEIKPVADHYSCMVDLLGRAGYLHEAEDLISAMPLPPNVVVWKALLSACKVHRDVELGERTSIEVLRLDPWNLAALILLSNIYAAVGRWDDKVRIRKLIEDFGMVKKSMVRDIR